MSPAKICDDVIVGEQQTDKVAISLTLKVCCKRRGGEGEGGNFAAGDTGFTLSPPHTREFCISLKCCI